MADAMAATRPAPGPRTLLVISAQPDPALPDQIARGAQPRRDYFELQHALGADLLLPADVAADGTARLVARAAGLRVALAWLAFRRRRAYDAIYTDGEGVGLPLAALLLAARPGAPRHTMLTHYLSPAKKRLWFRLGNVGVARRLDAVICHSAAQHELLTTALGLPRERALLLPYFADERFWRAEAVPAAAAPAADEEPVVCAVGLEFRDYDTLAAAAPRVPARVEIAAASHWSKHSAFQRTPELPANLHVAGYAYPALRELYARSRVVVVPLRPVDNQAGITVILEAMAMGKPVIATGTLGQTDVLRDRRNGGRGRMPRQWWPGFVDAPDLDPTLAHLPTGFYVAPDDPRELAAAITYLLQHPDVADELGRNGRRVFDACFTLDAFTARFAAVIRGEA
ncbi:MAG TPA: glycosyltransferase [Ktedonobacterales bacterium]|nr:glycosyltransferase [Ktedonobacterales bacterium]